MHLAEEVELLVNLPELLLELEDVLSRMWVQLLKLLLCLLQGMLLIRLPSRIVLQLYLRLQNVELFTQLL